MQTEYTQARDRQFNQQARIAAEAAINDARQIVYKAIGDRLNLNQFITKNDTAPPGCTTLCVDGRVTRDIDINNDANIDFRDYEAEAKKIAFYDANKDGRVDINDDILQKPYDTLLTEEWYDCGSGQNSASNRDGFDGDLDDAISDQIGYTCVEVDGRPVKLVYDDVDTDRSKNVLLQTRLLSGGVFDKSNIHTLTISWEGLGPQYPGSFKEASGPDGHEQRLPPGDEWGATSPMLRIQIIPLNIRDGWTREELNRSTRTYFLYPTRYGDSGINSAANIKLYESPETGDGTIVNADCDGDEERICSIEISGFDGSITTTSTLPYDINDAASNVGNISEGSKADDEMVYIMLIRTIYKDATLEISAQNSDSTCSPQPKCRELRFVNQQINITSTGRAGGLTYRLREVIPIRPKYNRPEYAIDSAEHICKLLIGEPDQGVSFDLSRLKTYTNPIGTQTSEEKAFCQDLHP